MAAAALVAELPALVLFFVTGIVGYLVAKWLGQHFVVPQKPPTKIAKSGDVSDKDEADIEHEASSSKAMELVGHKDTMRARGRQRLSRNLVSETGCGETSSAELASVTHESISMASKSRITTASLPRGLPGSKAAKKARRSKQGSAFMAEAEEEKDEIQTCSGLADNANPQPSMSPKNDTKLGAERPASTTAESGSDAHPFDWELWDATEGSLTSECSAARPGKPEGHSSEPCEPITAALQKLQQRLSEASEIKATVEGSAQLGSNSPESGGILIQKQKKNKEHLDVLRSGDIPESGLEYRQENDDEESDQDDAKYDEALRAILERAQDAKWQSPAGRAAPTCSPAAGDEAWAPRQAPWALMTVQMAGAVGPAQHDVVLEGWLRGARSSAQPLVPCPRNPGLYTNGQQVYHPVYVKVDPDADSVLDPKTHAVVESHDPEYGAYLNYINSCQSVVVMTQAPGCGGASPQLALVPDTLHARMRSQWSSGGPSLNHQRCSHGGDFWNMSWEKAPSLW